MKKQFYSTKEVADMLGITTASIHAHLRRRNFDSIPKPVKLGHKLAWPVDSTTMWINKKKRNL